jgi:hypothetical protein
MIWAHAADGFDNNSRVTSLSRFAARGRAVELGGAKVNSEGENVSKYKQQIAELREQLAAAKK